MENSEMTRAEVEKRLRRVLTSDGLEWPTYAVVVPVVCGGAGVELLVEVRAAGISQAGDPCFPGGRIEPGETPEKAAVRELGEELGIHIPSERLIGRLPTVHTYLGSKTDVFVCTLTPEEAAGACISRAEVSELMRIPLTFFLERPRAGSYTVDGNTIWGMTAGAIHHFCDAWKRGMTKTVL